MDLSAILVVAISSIFVFLGIWIEKRTTVTLKRLDDAREDARVEREKEEKKEHIAREERNRNIAEQTRIEIMSKIEESVKAHSPRCDLIHAQLEADMMKMAEQKVAEGQEIHADLLQMMQDNKREIDAIIKSEVDHGNANYKHIIENVSGIREDIKVLLTDRNKEDGIRRKYESIRLAAMRVFFDKGCKDFAIYKAEAFYDFIIKNMKTIYESKGNFNNAIATIEALYNTVKDQGYHLAGKEFTDCFYNEFHYKSTDQYLEQLRFILNDTLNNKEERFIDISMNYMQQFLSEMVMAYQSWKEDQVVSLTKTFHKED